MNSIADFPQHISRLTGLYSEGIEFALSKACPLKSVLLHSGSEDHYFGDDRGIPFQAFGHFLHWLPVNRPDQFIHFTVGTKPKYYQVVPDDFWYDQNIDLDPVFSEQFEVMRFASVSALRKQLRSDAIAYYGPLPECAESLGLNPILINAPALLSFLNFQRAIKSDYELAQLREANRIALQGHDAARQKFTAGANEYEIHMAYLQACEILEEESPYTNIVALDEKSAILHYQHKRRNRNPDAQVLLVDAGVRVKGYGSDITRTSVRDHTHAVFKSLLRAMELLEQDLVKLIKPNVAYPEIHEAALEGIADLLIQHELASASKEQLLEMKVAQLFMPHGVGHLLGIQVHDVGGHQRNIEGETAPPPSHAPALRNTRSLEEDMVFTIEPGFYFIPSLLEPERDKKRGALLNWNLIEELYPLGGIRVEDNIRVTSSGAENLTRQFEA